MEAVDSNALPIPPALWATGGLAVVLVSSPGQLCNMFRSDGLTMLDLIL